MRKLVYPVILVLIILIGIVYFFIARQSNGYSENSAFRAVPVKTPLIIEIPELDNLLEQLSKENPLVAELKQVKELNPFFIDIQGINTILKDNNQFRKVLLNKPVLVAFNVEGKSNIGCLFVSSLSNRKEKSELLNFFNNLPSSKGTISKGTISKRVYDNEEIYQIKSGKSSFSFAFKDGIFLFSRYSLFIEEAIRQIVAENLMDNQQFKDLYKTVSSNSDFNIYINHDKFPTFLANAIPWEFRKKLQLTRSFADWSELDVNISQSELLLNGYSFSNDSNNNYLNVFRSQKAIHSDMPDVLSANTSLFVNLSIENLDVFFKDYEEYLKKQGLYYSRETKLKTIERYSKAPFLKLFKEVAKENFAVAYETVTQNEPTQNRFFIVEVKGQSIAKEKILPVLENFAKVHKTNLQKRQSSYQIQNDRSFTIYQFPFPELPELLFGQAFSGVESQYLCFYDNYLLFADNSTALKNYIHDLVLSETLGNDIHFQKFNQQMANRSSFYFYADISKAFYLSNCYLRENLVKAIDENEQSIRKFHAFGWQFSENSGQFLNTLYLKFDPVLKEEPQTVWQSKLDSTVAIKPQLVINHTDKKNKEVIIQDNKNNLYLINKEGVSLWKIKLPGKIMSEIYQVDYYRNGKLQYLFSTKNQMHLIDRNGNNVARFPINFRSPATNGLAVFDYDNNRNYRFFIACENKQVYAYDREGKLINGWDFKGTDGLVRNPLKHFRVNNKDYIVCADQYKTYILDRRGNTRVKTTDNFEHSGNDLYLANVKGQEAIATTDVNGVIHLQYFDGKNENLKIQDFAKTHFFNAEDLNGNGKSDFVFADGNKLYAFTENGKKMFEREFNDNISSTPNIYMFANNNRKVGVVCRAENRVYLVNNDGSLYDGFPLHGNTDFTIGFFNPGNSYFNLVVGNQDNSFYNYQVE